MTEAPTTLVDTDVVLDVLTADPVWGARSAARLAQAVDEGPLVIDPIVYAEVAVGYERIEDLDDALSPDIFIREPIPWEAAFLAGRVHRAYRARGGRRDRTLPDFLIGAHAAVRGYRLLTRDSTRYRTAFPRLDVTVP